MERKELLRMVKRGTLFLSVSVLLILSSERVLYSAKEGPVAYFSMDEGKDNIIEDKSGNGSDGTIHGSTWIKGKFGAALSFNGVDNYIDCGNKETLNITDNLTISAWVKRGVFDTDLGIVGKLDWNKNHGGYGLRWYSDNRIYFYIKDKEADNANSIGLIFVTYELDTTDWVHLTATYKASEHTANLFVN